MCSLPALGTAEGGVERSVAQEWEQRVGTARSTGGENELAGREHRSRGINTSIGSLREEAQEQGTHRSRRRSSDMEHRGGAAHEQGSTGAGESILQRVSRVTKPYCSAGQAALPCCPCPLLAVSVSMALTNVMLMPLQWKHVLTKR